MRQDYHSIFAQLRQFSEQAARAQAQIRALAPSQAQLRKFSEQTAWAQAQIRALTPSQAQLRKFSEQAARAQAQIRATLAPSETALRQIAAQAAGFERVRRSVIKEIRPSMLALQRAIVDSSVIERLFEAWDARQTNAAAILAEKGWWLSPDFPMTLLNVVVEMKQNGQGRRVNRLICDYYTQRRLSALVTKWMQHRLFKRRKGLLREAWRAHRDRKWVLSIPVLLAQLEGILRDYADEAGLSKRQSVKKIAEKLEMKSSDSTLISRTWLAQLHEIFGSGYFSTKRTHSGLRRNAILHGLELHYGTEVRSTQLFLQLDTIYWLITEKAKKKAA